jgi:hypothetical protein
VDLMVLLQEYTDRPDWNTQRLLIRKIVELCAIDFKVEDLTLNDIDVLGNKLPEIVKVIYGSQTEDIHPAVEGDASQAGGNPGEVQGNEGTKEQVSG